MMSDMVLEFWYWWYGPGWLDITHRVGNRVVAVWHLFSVAILLQTLFSPWKRIITPPGKSMDAIMRALVDNTVSRVVGFFVRMFSLIAMLVMTTVASVVGFVIVVVWPLLPVATAYCIARSFI